MSHFTTVKTEIRDIAALEAAVKELGFELGKSATVRGYGSNRTTAEVVIRLPDGYDLGFNRNTDGTYSAVGDFWQDHISKYLGKDLGKLKQGYAKHLVLQQARKKGYFLVSNEKQKDGTLRLRLRVGGGR